MNHKKPYPAPIKEANLSTITEITKRFDVISGLSDHTKGILISTLASVMGASIIEKHFTLNREDKGPDSSFSIEPNELKDLKKITFETWKAIGKENFERSEKEKENKIFRRSLSVVISSARQES